MTQSLNYYSELLHSATWPIAIYHRIKITRVMHIEILISDVNLIT